MAEWIPRIGARFVTAVKSGQILRGASLSCLSVSRFCFCFCLCLTHSLPPLSRSLTHTVVGLRPGALRRTTMRRSKGKTQHLANLRYCVFVGLIPLVHLASCTPWPACPSSHPCWSGSAAKDPISTQDSITIAQTPCFACTLENLDLLPGKKKMEKKNKLVTPSALYRAMADNCMLISPSATAGLFGICRYWTMVVYPEDLPSYL